jgi:predicted MFS family arabinose efflux permease
VAAEPDPSSASVALNTSVLYTGQAIGSALGGLLFALGYVHAVSFAGVAFVALGIGVWSITRDRAVAIKS